MYWYIVSEIISTYSNIWYTHKTHINIKLTQKLRRLYVTTTHMEVSGWSISLKKLPLYVFYLKASAHTHKHMKEWIIVIVKLDVSPGKGMALTIHTHTHTWTDVKIFLFFSLSFKVASFFCCTLEWIRCVWQIFNTHTHCWTIYNKFFFWMNENLLYMAFIIIIYGRLLLVTSMLFCVVSWLPT